jgi:hypothetical protein
VGDARIEFGAGLRGLEIGTQRRRRREPRDSRQIIGTVAITAAMATLLAIGLGVGTPVAVAASNTLVFLSAAQTVAPSSNSNLSPAPSSGSVIVEAQNGSGVPLEQPSPLTVTVTTSGLTGGVGALSIPASIIIPAGSSSGSFTFAADNSSTSLAGTFVVTVSAPGYLSVQQTETVEPSGGDPTTVVQPGYVDGDPSSTPVAVGSSVSYFVGGTAQSYIQAGAAAADYEVVGVGGVVPHGGGAITGEDYCVEVAAGAKGSFPQALGVDTSTLRPGGDYTLGFLVEEYGAGTKCTGAVTGYYEGDADLEVTTSSAYTPLTPTRLLDTRTPAGGGPLGPGGTRQLGVTGDFAPGVVVPANATAVALNLTVTDTTQASYLSAYPTGSPAPTVSNLNWPAGATVANLAVVPVGAGGSVTFYNLQGNTQLVVDLEGYFAAEVSGSTAGAYVPLTPQRVVDTRTGSGYFGAGQSLAAGGALTFPVGGQGDVPTSGASAVVLNVTATDTTAASYFTAYPTGQPQPLASNVNWTAGETVPNRVIVPLGTGGEVTIYNANGGADLVVDVDGYFTDGTTTLPASATLFQPTAPQRLLDTREGSGPIGAGQTLSEPMAGAVNSSGEYLVAANATAAMVNVTVTDTTANSFLTVFPGGSRPLASDLNWTAGETVPNLTLATFSSAGAVSFYNHAGSTQLVLDVFGYFLPFT